MIGPPRRGISLCRRCSRSRSASGADQSTTPTWAKADHFWYRRAVSGGHLWLTVDAQHGVRSATLRSPAARHRAESADRGRVHAADVAVRGSGGRVRRQVRRLERVHSSGRDGHRVHPRRPALALRARDQMGLEQGPADRLRVPASPAGGAGTDAAGASHAHGLSSHPTAAGKRSSRITTSRSARRRATRPRRRR